jgi:hypothetical protein
MQFHLHQVTDDFLGQIGVGAQRQCDVLGSGEVGQQAVALQQHADALA